MINPRLRACRGERGVGEEFPTLSPAQDIGPLFVDTSNSRVFLP